MSLKTLLRSLANDESGQNLIEYALVAGLVGLAAITAMTNLGTGIGTAFSTVGSRLAASV